MTFEEINIILRQYVEEHNTRDARNFYQEHCSEIRTFSNEQQIQILEKCLILEFKAEEFRACHELIEKLKYMALSAPPEFYVAIKQWEANVALEEDNIICARECLRILRETINRKGITNHLLTQDVENLGIRVYIKTKQYKRIRKIYRKLIANPNLERESKLKLFHNIGLMYYLRGEYPSAISFFIRVIKDNTNLAFSGYSFMYLARMNTNQYKKQLYQKAFYCFWKLGSRKFMQIVSNEYERTLNEPFVVSFDY